MGTPIDDTDGVYDPRLYNDRLLLGLKGTVSEAELYLMRQRLNAGRLRKAQHGEYVQRLPPGLVTEALDSIEHRGPDHQGHFACEQMTLGATRLRFTRVRARVEAESTTCPA